MWLISFGFLSFNKQHIVSAYPCLLQRLYSCCFKGPTFHPTLLSQSPQLVCGAPKYVHVPRIGGHLTIHGKRDFAD